VIEELLQQLIERLDNRYYGKYRGYVSNVSDPQKQGRVKAYVPRLLGETETGWAMPCAPYAGPDQGFYAVPELGAGVWIEFEGGDLSKPIWAGTWWGKPEATDINQPDSTAREAPLESELPKDYLLRLADPQVKIFKSGTGHFILLDDRDTDPRVEIADRQGNRIILSNDGLTTLVHNESTVNEGNRTNFVDGNDVTRVGGSQLEQVVGNYAKDVTGSASIHVKGDFKEVFDAAGYTRTVDANGFSETWTGPRNDNLKGGYTRTVAGAVDDTAMGGFGLTSGGNVQIAAGKAFKVAAVMPDLPGPSINAISLDALLGNVSINTFLGFCQIGGMSAVSPAVLGDGLAIHHMMLAQFLKVAFAAVNPFVGPAVGPLFDVWAAMTPLMDWSFFALLKRFPFGP
jgi:type VI secretion system secreted protein VgrG